MSLSTIAEIANLEN